MTPTTPRVDFQLRFVSQCLASLRFSAQMRASIFCLMGLCAALFAMGCQGMQSGRVQQREQLAELSSLMIGGFSSSAQHEQQKDDYFNIHLSMTPIWPERTTDDQTWLYVEQAMSQARQKPYRQRIYRVMPLASDKQIEITLPGDGPGRTAKATFVSEVYKIPSQAAYINADGDPSRFVGLTPEMLEPLAGCGVLLARTAPGVFEGGTQGGGCASSLRGAAYVTSEVYVSREGLRTWDRGFDKDGKYVWGAEKGPYEFQRE